MSDAVHTFQFSSARHQMETAFAGMWLFLASEALFFGPLFLAWIYARHWNAAGFDAGAQQTSLTIGVVNTAILLSSSYLYSVGLAFLGKGQVRAMMLCLAFAWLLGASFILLKFGVEWREDFRRSLFPGAAFSIDGPLRDGAQLFFVFYFVSTAIHGLHLLVGLGLVAWILARARHFSASAHAPATIVGLYWGFVDMVWVILFPLIYLIGR
ncbi:cytochrome c oxidase subunit 3 [Methylocystis sp. JAN1]|uniref:cytochrome c oxidase subunit 3 n=1 Tax=Methylocystis sp. JAN1 TaxID=3397211 RepID=UPI003FA1D8DF